MQTKSYPNENVNNCSKCDSVLVDLFTLNPRNYAKDSYYCNSCSSEAKPKPKLKIEKVKQTSFPNSLPDCSIEVIRSKNKLDKVLEGGEKLKFVSYSTSIDSLTDFFEMGYQKIEYICGEYLIDSFKKLLSEKKISDVKKLNDYVRKGQLEVFVPKKIEEITNE